jgi:hypothetical protein
MLAEAFRQPQAVGPQQLNELGFGVHGGGR